MSELNDVLSRPKFERYVAQEARLQFLASFVHEAVAIEIVEKFTARRDAKDDKFLEVAVNGSATCIVTGDADLLVLHPFRGIPIITPREFLDAPVPIRGAIGVDGTA